MAKSTPAAIVPALDGVRGIAILMVMIYHYTFRFAPTTTGEKVLHSLGALGWSGVDLFFVLSGFLITGILLKNRGRRGYYSSFFIRRTLRIFPLYYAFLFVVMILLPAAGMFDTPDLRALEGRQIWLWTYTQNVAVAIAGEWLFNVDWVNLNHLWSLAVEEHFYLFWPFIVAALSPRNLLRLCLGVVAVVPLARFVALAAGISPLATYALTPFRADALMLGGALAVVLSQPVDRRRLRFLGWSAIIGGTAVLLGLVVATSNATHHTMSMQTIGFSLLIAIYGGLIALAARDRGGPLEWPLTLGWLRAAGKYGYAGYIFHQVLQPPIEAVASPDVLASILGSATAGLAAHVLIGITASFALAVVSWHLVEKRFLALKSRFTVRDKDHRPREHRPVGDCVPTRVQ